MKKKELLKIPLPSTVGPGTKADADRVYIHASVAGGILVLSLHDGSDLRRGKAGPMAVSYISRDEERWTSWRHCGDNVKWTDCMLRNLFPYWRPAWQFFTEEEAATVLEYFEVRHDGTGSIHSAALHEVSAFEYEKTALRGAGGDEVRRRILSGESAMEGMPKPPEGLEEWVFNRLLKPKLIYAECPDAPEKMRIHCTACGGELVGERKKAVIRKKGITCPLCGRNVTGAKANGRSCFFDACYAKIAVLQRLSEDTYVWRYFSASDWTDFMKMEWKRNGMAEIGRDFLSFDGDSVQYARYEYQQKYGRMRWLPARENGEYVRYSQMEAVSGLQRYAYGSVIYPGNLEEELGKDERFRYFPLKDIAEGDIRRNMWRHYEFSLESYLKFPKVELLIRVGLLNIASAFLTSFPCGFDEEKRIDCGADSLLGILRLRTRTSLSQLRRFDSLEALEIIQDAEKRNAVLTDRELKKRLCWSEILECGGRMRQLDAAGVEPRKFLRYMEKETGNRRPGKEKFARFADRYLHYIDALRFLEVAVDKENRYPSQLESLIPAIDRQVELKNKLLEANRLRELNDAIMKTARRIEEALLGSGMEEGAVPGTFQMPGDGSLCICLPHSKEDLSSEGSHLDHCVGRQGYDLRMAKGETAVVFLRKQSKPGTSFYTMEVNLRTGELIQCRTHGNGSYDELLSSDYEIKREIYSATKGRTSLPVGASLFGMERDEILRLSGCDEMTPTDRQFAEAMAAVLSSKPGSYDSDLMNLHLSTGEYISSAGFFTEEDFLPVLRKLRKAKKGRREVYHFAKRFEKDYAKALIPA